MTIIIIPNNNIMTARHYCLAKALVASGHSVHYAQWELPYNIKLGALLRHLFTSLIPKQYMHEDLVMHKVSRLPYFWPVVNGWLFHAQLRSIFKKTKADIIFAEGYTNEIDVPKDLPFIYDLADDYAAPADVYGSPIYKLAFKLLGIRSTMKKQCQHALAVTAVSKILYEYAQGYNDKVVMLPNGVDSTIIRTVNQQLADEKVNPHSLIYVTGFGVWSRAIETMQTIMNLRAEFPALELTLVGHGSEVDKMKDFIAANKVDSYIHYLGFMSDRERLFKTMHASAIGLNISDKNKWRDAAHPIKVIEYTALGKKVVSTNLNEVIQLGFPNIYLFDDKVEERSFEQALREALSDTAQTDYGMLQNQVLETYNWDKIAAQLVELCEQSLASTGMS